MKKQALLCMSSSVFKSTLQHIQLDNFCLWNCLWIQNAHRLVAQKIFLLQIFGETSIFTLPVKVPLCQKNVKMMFWVPISVWISIYILKFKFLFKNNCSTRTAWNHVGLLKWKSEMIYLPKKVCLIIIHTNTAHILDMFCCHQH